MEIKGFIESSLLEWPGRLAAVIFLPFCNLRCRYCHATHLLDPHDLETLPRKYVFSRLAGQQGWLDGVVITGGEPTLHANDLLELVQDIRALGLDVMIETNGTQPYWIGRLIKEERIQAVAMDVKAPLNDNAYQAVVGGPVSTEAVRTSIDLIKESGLPHEFRITVVPGIVGEQEVEQIAPELVGADTVVAQNFQPDHCLDPSLHAVRPYSPEEMDAFRDILLPCARFVIIRGRERITA